MCQDAPLDAGDSLAGIPSWKAGYGLISIELAENRATGLPAIIDV